MMANKGQSVGDRQSSGSSMGGSGFADAMPSLNRMTVIAIVCGVLTGFLWLTMFVGAGVYGPVAGMAAGLVGSVCGAVGFSQARRNEGEDRMTALVGLLCPVVGLLTSAMMTFTVVSVHQGLSETTAILTQMTEKLSSVESVAPSDRTGSRIQV